MQDDHQEKQELLEEIREMLNIPQLERIIFHKIKELKFFFGEEVDRYRQLKESFRRIAYGDIQVIEPGGGTAEKIQTYHFEINLDKNNVWVTTLLEPSPPPGYEIYDIMPEEIVKYIVSVKSKHGKIETQKEVSFPAIEGKAFDLSFCQYSDSHILGTIKGYNVALQGTEAEPPDDLTDIYYYNPEKNDEGNFRDLIYYMQKYPSVKHYFFTELNMKMKPLIIGKLIDITSSSRPVDQF